MKTNNTQQATWVAIGSFFSFLVGIVSPMILSRYFDKADYGTYKQVMYVYGTLLTVFTLGLPRSYSYFIPKVSVGQAKTVINKITQVFFVLGAVFSLSLFACAEPIANILKNDDLVVAIKLFSPVPLLLLPTMGLDGIYASFRKTQYTAIYSVVMRILTIVFTVFPVIVLKGSYLHAIVGFDIAAVVSCVVALYLKTLPVKRVTPEATDITYRKIFAFSLPLLYASLWGTIISSADQFFISRYFGNKAFAEFSNGFVEIPFVGMVISGLTTVLLPLFSRMEKDGTVLPEDAVALWKSTLEKSTKIVFPMLIFSIFTASVLMSCMYGDRYVNSTPYFVLKNIGGLLYVIPFAPVMIALGKVKEYARIHLIAACIIVTAEWACVSIFDTPLSIAVVSILVMWIKVAYMLCVIAKTIGVSIQTLLPIRKILIVFVVSVLSGITCCVALHFVTANKFILLTISFAVFSGLYYLLCWVCKITYKEIVSSILPQKYTKHIIKIIP